MTKPSRVQPACAWGAWCMQRRLVVRRGVRAADWRREPAALEAIGNVPEAIASLEQAADAGHPFVVELGRRR